MDGVQRVKGEVVVAVDATDECLRDSMPLAGAFGPWGGPTERGGGRGGQGGGGDGHRGGRGSDSEHTLSGHTSPPGQPVRLSLDRDSGAASGQPSGDIGSRCGLLDCGSETGSGSCSCRRSRGSGSGSGVGSRDGGSAADGTGTGGKRTGGLSPLALPPPPPLLPYGDSHSLCDGTARLGGDTSGLRDLLQTPPQCLTTMGIGSPLDLDIAVGGMESLGEMGGTLGGVGGLAPVGQLSGMSGIGGMGGMGGLGGLNGVGGLGLADLGSMGGLGGVGASMGMALGLSAEMGLLKGFSSVGANLARGGGTSDLAAGDTDAAIGLGALSVDNAMVMDLMDDRPPATSLPQDPRSAAAAGAVPHADATAVATTPSGPGALTTEAEGANGCGGGRGNLDSLAVGATTAGTAATASVSAKDTQARPEGASPRHRHNALRSKAASPTSRADSRHGDSRKVAPPKAEYRCTFEGCSKTFARRYNRVVHSRKHTGETPYQCPHMACSLRFKWRSSLAHHARSVHGSFTPASSPSSVTISAGGGSGGPSPRNVTPLGDTGTSAADAVVARAAVVAGSAATAAAITAGGSGVAAPSGASLDGVPPPQDLNLCTRAADKDVTMRDASAGASLAVTPLPLPRPPPPRRHQSGWRPRGAGSRQPSGPRGPQ